MEVLEEIGLYIGGIGVYAVVFVLALLAVLLPLSAYSAQKWMYKNYLETKSVNAKLTELLQLARTAQSQYQQPEDKFVDSDSRRREPTIGKDLNIPL
jgi:Tfp pilus assembly protein FimT